MKLHCKGVYAGVYLKGVVNIPFHGESMINLIVLQIKNQKMSGRLADGDGLFVNRH